MLIIIALMLVANLYLIIYVNRCDPRDWIVSALIWTLGGSATHLIIGAVAGLCWSFIISHKKRREQEKTLRHHARDVWDEARVFVHEEILTPPPPRQSAVRAHLRVRPTVYILSGYSLRLQR